MTRTRRPIPVRSILLAAALALGSCRGACHRGGGADRAATVEGRLALFPAATQVVAAIDVGKLRGSPAATKLSSLATESSEDKKTIEEFAQRTGFNPLTQLSSVTVAFPDEARKHGELGLVLRADRLDEARLVAYVRDQLQKSGDDLVSTTHGRFTLWSTKKDPDVAGFFIDPQTFALGGGGWAAKMADLAEAARPGDSAATNVQLTRLVERAAGSHAIWAAAIVSESTRKAFGGEPGAGPGPADNIQTLSAGVDLGKGLDVVLLADMATPADARALAAKATDGLRDAKRDPQVLMLGLGPYLDGITAHAADRTLEIRAALGEAALDDLVTRLKGLAAMARGGQLPLGKP
jgi:hypothetical protein